MLGPNQHPLRSNLAFFGLNMATNSAFTLDVKSMLNVNLGGILGGTQC
jgi:hypothetical protein